MKLKSIKLVGFKSFIEPTTITFPSSLVAIVGPNGCGKSNIIDAVRWVLGESSAKSLRGESISDVIFNGSMNHAPLGQASIELLFDNSDGCIGGEYASYAEIAVMRKITRDGTSDYFLNGKRCRRRDVVGLFLGTGLGPRSYAIIEQGMISRLIESKPEELRGFLEEAAGISKYKERRRETENRMRHTQENLDRLSDVRDELERQLQHLQRQAKAAEHYRTLKQDERLYQAQCQALQWLQFDQQMHVHKQRIDDWDTQLTAVTAELHTIDAQIQATGQQCSDKRAKLDTIQGQYYGLGTAIAQTEQLITHQQDKQQQLQQTLAQTEQHIEEAHTHLSDDQQRQHDHQQQLAELRPELTQIQQVADQAAEQLLAAETALQDCQQAWETFHQRATIPCQRAKVQQSTIEQLEHSLRHIQHHIEQLEAEQQQLNDELTDDTPELAQQVADMDQQIDSYRHQIEESTAQLNQQRQLNTQNRTALDTARQQLQKLHSQQASLEALQQAAMGRNHESQHNWLKDHDLVDNPRLAATIQVKRGWEKAVEMVLGDHLQAVCVEGLEAIAQWVENLKQGTLTLVDRQSTNISCANQSGSLASKLEADEGAAALLTGVYAADDLSEALAMRDQLMQHESVVTKNGCWLGPNWLRLRKDSDEHDGFFQRQQVLDTLIADVRSCEQQVANFEAKLAEGRGILGDSEGQHEQWQQELQGLIQQRGERYAQLNAQQLRIEQQTVHRRRVQQSLADNRARYKSEQDDLVKARICLQQALDVIEQDKHQRDELITQRDDKKKLLEQAKQAAHQHKEHAHQSALQVQVLQTQLDAMQNNDDRIQQQLAQWQQHKQSLLEDIDAMDEPLAAQQATLDRQLAERIRVEEILTTTKQEVDALEYQIRESDSKRRDLEQQLNQLRSKLEKERVQAQGAQVNRDNIEQQLTTFSLNIEAILQDLPEAATLATCQNSLQTIERKIARLGAINLAAIEEYQTVAERKAQLDKQCDDVLGALETLRDAIGQIDKETKQRLQDTFDTVNQNLQELFPKIFGGGKAYLDTTSDDLLNTGIAIMAQPPGKRNATIHLLSGGEKALTAIAMVFSLFRLNPTPFCILDEVDAPLDDANVERYVRLVKNMSQEVQFIYITHNKIAMEMAEQLMGVTMHEPGVSRLVTVDIDKAAAMAA